MLSFRILCGLCSALLFGGWAWGTYANAQAFLNVWFVLVIGPWFALVACHMAMRRAGHRGFLGGFPE
jgi:hypothetical protein